MRYALFWISAVVIIAMTATASAHGGDPWKGEVAIEVVSDSGSAFRSIPLRSFRSGGTRIVKHYLEARRGENYGVIVRNMTPKRIGVVLAVDGRNIISGKRSDLGSHESLYVLNGCEQARYDGWRTAEDRVHRFYFTETADSYAAKTFGDTTAMGVIAVAVYRERERPRPQHEQKRRENAPAPPAESPAEGRAGALMDRSAGTGFGDGKHSPTVTVAFEPEPVPVQKSLIKYEWRETLCRKGILPCRQERGNRLWDEDGYAPYPPGYPAR
jgi:hypothetical protein